MPQLARQAVERLEQLEIPICLFKAAVEFVDFGIRLSENASRRTAAELFVIRDYELCERLVAARMM